MTGYRQLRGMEPTSQFLIIKIGILEEEVEVIRENFSSLPGMQKCRWAII